MNTNFEIFPQKKYFTGIPEGFDAIFLIEEMKRMRTSFLHICTDYNRLLSLKNAINFFKPNLPTLTFPAWDCVPYDRISPNSNIISQRITTLSELSVGLSKDALILTTVNAVTQKVPPIQFFRKSFFKIRVGESIPMEKLKIHLVEIGYEQASSVMQKCEFAMRGGIIDIFPANEDNPVRLDFFGDTIDQIKIFDPITQLTIDHTKNITLVPANEILLNKVSIQNFRREYRLTLGALGASDPVYEAISAGRAYLGFEHWLPLFHTELHTFVDYLPGIPVSIDSRVEIEIEKRWEFIKEQYQNRVYSSDKTDNVHSTYNPLNPEFLYIKPERWPSLLSKRDIYSISALQAFPGQKVKNFKVHPGRNFAPERQQKSGILFKELALHIRKKLLQGPVIIATYSLGSRDRIRGMLNDNGLQEIKLIDDFTAVSKTQSVLALAVLPIENGFESADLTVISEQDILGDRLIRSSRKIKKPLSAITDLSALSLGDYVVHIEHGLGKYVGLESIETLGVCREYLNLEYDGGDKLLIPVENLEVLTKYGQDTGVLDRLGSSSWQGKKARLKKRLLVVAEKLIGLAAERALKSGTVFRPPDIIWDEFCSRFPYQETDDQINAINDVLGDLESGTPMDRLICGDVGFGKTEVALRAAFVVGMAGKQVAMVVPTTLLCRQHFQTFRERFRGLPIKIAQLSRFVSNSSITQIKKEIRAGQLDIIVGTHALLSDSVEFFDLGLVIIDEEQHFGVMHKEKLKNLKSDVHVLTLTATPIPRTLQLALSGARELSLITTAPVDRVSIRTYQTDFDSQTIRDALMREYYRGGQSFFVVPRVADLEPIKKFLLENLPELKVVVASGKLGSSELDKAMTAFCDRKYDVLLATTIIESGLDIPSANTLIVYRAEMFGLAQLYQIRGRVGRSKIRAYAYLITDIRKTITIQAEKRLSTLLAMENLGMGFSVASQDMDIRGAGNLLGDEQSGHIKEVGFELYQKLLEEAMSKVKTGSLKINELNNNDWSPEINLNVAVLIPDRYVSDLDTRLILYRKLSNLNTKIEIEGFAAELIDRFGKLPPEVSMLINIVKIKNKCRSAGIVKFSGGPKGATIQFYKDKFKNQEGLLQFIHKESSSIKIKGRQLVVRRNWVRDSDRVKGAFLLASELAKYTSQKNTKKTPSKEGASY